MAAIWKRGWNLDHVCKYLQQALDKGVKKYMLWYVVWDWALKRGLGICWEAPWKMQMWRGTECVSRIWIQFANYCKERSILQAQLSRKDITDYPITFILSTTKTNLRIHMLSCHAKWGTVGTTDERKRIKLYDNEWSWMLHVVLVHCSTWAAFEINSNELHVISKYSK